MLIDTPNIRSRLHGIVNRLAPPPLREDLMQEAMVHLWRTEDQDPGRDAGWYLQGCRFHLQNFVRQGRSVDSWKRFLAQDPKQPQLEDELGLYEQAASNGSPWDEASVNDFLAALLQWLIPQEKETLLCLMDGLSARETAQRLGISHTMVNRYRSRIASVASNLGLERTRTPAGRPT